MDNRNMTTEQMEDRILEYLEGGLSREEEQALLGDAAADRAFGAMLDEYRQQERQLEALFKAPAEHLAKQPKPKFEGMAGVVTATQPLPRRRLYWTAAAATLLVASLSAGHYYFNVRSGGDVGSVLVAEGRPQSIGSGVVKDIAANSVLGSSRRVIKTPAESYLEVELARDGGRLEVNANSSMVVTTSRRGPEIELERGEILVHAEGRESSLVRVNTPQLRVEGRDAVFSVVRGLRGSEIGVVSGEVEFWLGGVRRRLSSGESFSSIGAEPLPVIHQVAWSPNFAALEASLPRRPGMDRRIEIASATSSTASGASSSSTTVQVVRMSGEPSIAFGTRLLPPGTFLVLEVRSVARLLEPLGVKNLAELVTEENVGRLLDQVTAATPLKAADAKMMASRVTLVLRSEPVRVLLESLTGSVSVGMTKDGPVLVADVSSNGPRVADVVNNQVYPIMAALLGDVKSKPRLLVENGYLLVGLNNSAFDEMAGAARSATSGSFGRSEFLSEIGETVSGSRFYLALDVQGMRQRIMEGADADNQSALDKFSRRTGLANMKSVVAATDFGDQAENQALRVLFDGQREGVMSWLGAPGAMGSLRFFSPDALAMTSMKVRRPAEMLEEITGWLLEEGSALGVPQTERQMGLLKRLSATLGNEVALGVEMPLLPIPNVKVAIEVLDPQGFHEAMLALLEELWRSSPDSMKLAVDSQPYRGHLVVDFKYPGVPFGLSYALIDDFVVFGPSRAAVKATVDIAEEGRCLGSEFAFQESLPAKSGSHVSWLVYQAMNENISDALNMIDSIVPQDVPFRPAAFAQLGKGKGAVGYAIAEGETIDFFIEGMRVGEFKMTEAIPFMANLLSSRSGERVGREESAPR
jgi:ferric-dicitrate binding protein FerR (iron transport regulator)